MWIGPLAILAVAVVRAQTLSPTSAPVASYALSRVSGATPVFSTGTPTTVGTVSFGAQPASPDASGLTRAVSAVNGDTWTVNVAGYYLVQVNAAPIPTGNRLALSRNLPAGTAWASATFAQQLAEYVALAGIQTSVSWTGFLALGDVLRVYLECPTACSFSTVDEVARVTPAKFGAAGVPVPK